MNLVPAPLGRRFGAYLLDGLVIWGVSLLLGTVMGVAFVGPNLYAVPLGWYVMSGIVAFFYMSGVVGDWWRRNTDVEGAHEAALAGAGASRAASVADLG